MLLSQFLEQLNQQPENITFADTMAVIEANYDFSETAFSNGHIVNQAGQNNGSCKIFAFAQLNQLSPEHTLHCFGDYYRIDVLQNPQGDDHQNIRNFVQHGWQGIAFKGTALAEKEP